MLRFKQFLIEALVRPKFGINEPTYVGKTSPIADRPLGIFTAAAGYGRDWNAGGEGTYNPKADVLVHTTNYFPYGGTIRTRGSVELNTIPFPDLPRGIQPINRETVHFTRNGLVSSHVMGNFNNRPFTILAPQGPLLPRIIGSRDEDTYMFGNVEVPHGSKILIHEPSLRTADREKLARMGNAQTLDQIKKQLEKGMDVSFGDRKVTLQLTKDDIEKSVEAQLREMGLKPVKIGETNAVGFAQKPSSSEQKVLYRPNNEPDFLDLIRKREASVPDLFGGAQHYETPFARIEYASKQLGNSEEINIPNVPKAIKTIKQRIGRDLFPEEQAAIDRQQEWYNKAQEWRKKMYSLRETDPEIFKASMETTPKKVHDSEHIMRELRVGAESATAERKAARKAASIEAVKKYRKGDIGAGGLALAGGMVGSALTHGADAMTDVLGMYGIPPTPKDRMQIEKDYQSDIGLGFNLSPENELEGDIEGRRAAQKRQQRGVNFTSMIRDR